MRRILSVLILTVLLATFALTPSDQASGQAKKKEPPVVKKENPPAAKTGSIEVYKAKDGYRFRIKDGDGKTVAMPTKGYEEKNDCLKAIEFVKTTLNNAKPTEVKE